MKGPLQGGPHVADILPVLFATNPFSSTWTLKFGIHAGKAHLCWRTLPKVIAAALRLRATFRGARVRLEASKAFPLLLVRVLLSVTASRHRLPQTSYFGTRHACASLTKRNAACCSARRFPHVGSR